MPTVVELDAEPSEDRPRQWHAWIKMRGADVELTHHAILAPGEDLSELPPRKTVSWQGWEQTHADYGMDIAGQRLEA